MKIGQSALYFLLILVVVGILFFAINKKSENNGKILLQTLACRSDKLDTSVLNLSAKTEQVEAYVGFKQVPITDQERSTLTKLGIKLDEQSWIFERAMAQIPTASLCELVADTNVNQIFIPQIN